MTTQTRTAKTFLKPVTAVAAAVALATMAVAPAALADRGGYGRYDRAPEFDYARVIDVDPITREVRREVPVRECWDETRVVRERPGPRGTAGGAILGGLIGAAIGNQVGRGDGRRAATVAGAIIGGAIGHDVAEQKRDERGYYPPREREYTEERCETRYETEIDQRIEGYRVTYEYQGRTYQTRLPYDPGKEIRVRVDVAPAER